MVFHGKSGTGKTMTAEALAHELGVPLYVIDLSRVFSKWVGETEKNLKSIFNSTFKFFKNLVDFFDRLMMISLQREYCKPA